MGFFYISAPFLSGSKQATHREINDVVIKKSVADGKQIFLDKKKFKLANLDTLMMVNDKLLKLENIIQSFLKKVDRQFLDLQEKSEHEWYIKAGQKQYTIPKFLYNFNWNDSKYPRSYPLPRIAEIIQAKIGNFQNQLRNKTNSYNQTKSQLAQNTQKEGNYYVRDLTDLLVEPNISPQDFVYSKFITTMIVIVPVVAIQEFKANYGMISEYVIPYSAQKLNVPEKDGLSVWKINIFNEKIDQEQMREQEDDKKKNKRNLTPTQDFIQKARERLKVVAKQFKFQTGLADKKKKKKQQLENRLTSQNKAVSDICLAYFSQAYELYCHAKILRLIVQTNMRFGSDQTVVYLVQTQGGKQGYVQKLLVDIFGDKDSEGLYGTKDEIDDGQDFFPFIYVPCIVL